MFGLRVFVYLCILNLTFNIFCLLLRIAGDTYAVLAIMLECK